MDWEARAKIVTAFVAVGAFSFGIYEFLQVRAIEAAKPYLERKLAWCEEAVEKASRIANSKHPAEEDIERFWQMYYGVMGMIEKAEITEAMEEYGAALDDKAWIVLQGRSLKLAHACRKELSAEWSPLWSTPVDGPAKE